MASKHKSLSEEKNREQSPFSAAQASAYLGISEKTLLKWSSKGLVDVTESSDGDFRFSIDELDRFIRWHGSGASKKDIYSQVHRMRMQADINNDNQNEISSPDSESQQHLSQFNVLNKKLNLLLDMARILSTDLEMHDALAKIASRISKLFGVEISEFYFYDSNTDEIELAAFTYDKAWDTIGKRYKVQDWPYIKLCIETRCPQVMHRDDEHRTAQIENMEIWEEHAYMAIPLSYKDNLVGVLNIVNPNPGSRFSKEDISLAEDIANHAAIAIHNLYQVENIKKRNVELSTLLDVTEAVTSSIDLNSVLKMLTDILHDMIDIFSVEIYQYDEKHMTLQSLAETDDTPDPESWTGTYHMSDLPAFEQCVRNGETVACYIDDPELPELTRQDMELWNEKSALCIPMIYNKKVVGLTCLSETRKNRRFTEDDIRLTRAIVVQGSAAIVNAQNFEREQFERVKLEKINKRLEALIDVSGRIKGLVDDHELIMLLGRVMSEAMGFKQWVVYSLSPEIKCFKIVASGGSMKAKTMMEVGHTFPEHFIEGIIADSDLISRSYFIDHNKHKWTMAENENLPKDDLEETAAGEWHRGDMLILPMIGEMGQRLGFVSVYAPDDKILPAPEDVKLMELFTSKIASSIELHQTYRKLTDQAITDGLTGLYNHRHMRTRLDEEVTKAERYETPLSIIMVDIDDFKKFNDTYGHPQGDKLLKKLSKLLLKGTRHNVDVVARYGGEEFLAILPNTPIEESKFIAERLRLMVERAKFEGDPSMSDVNITLSIGVALFPEHGHSAEELVTACDKALYFGKRTGKNKVCIFSE